MEEWEKQKIEDIKVMARKIRNRYDAITETGAMAIVAAEQIYGVESLNRCIKSVEAALIDDFDGKNRRNTNWLDSSATRQNAKAIEDFLKVAHYEGLAKELAKLMGEAEKYKQEINNNIKFMCEDLQADRDFISNDTIKELIKKI